MVCEVSVCDRPAKTRGLCGAHYERQRLSGSTRSDEPLQPRTGNGSITKTGYRQVRRTGHILSGSSGDVLEHRVVLFDAIGYGPHLCHWCGLAINWSKEKPSSRCPHLLVVDHLDGDRLNNDLSNLVPSCQPCNWRRAEIWRYRWRRYELQGAMMDLPDGMTADKLQFIAKYISECDSIIGNLLRRAREESGDESKVTPKMLEFVDGKAVQADLTAWADEILTVTGRAVQQSPGKRR